MTATISPMETTFTITQSQLDVELKKSGKRGYQKGRRGGIKHGKDIGINICLALGRLTGQPKGYYKALNEVIKNLELK